MEENTQRQTGTIKWFNTMKGYGFIAPDAGGNDLFVHANDLNGVIPNDLREGTRVEFTVTEGQKGPQANDVTLAEAADQALPEAA